MTVPGTVARDRLAETVERLEVGIGERQRRLATGAVPDERVPAAVADLGAFQDALARALVAVEEYDRAREAYAEAAVYYHSAVRESKARRSTLRPRQRHDDPWTCIHAIERGLLADRPDLAECAARETRSMGQTFLAEHDNRSYYAAKLLASVVLDDGESSRHAGEYRNALAVGRAGAADHARPHPGGDADDPSEPDAGDPAAWRSDPGRYRAEVAARWDREDVPDDDLLFVYEGIAEGDADRVAHGLAGLLERRRRVAGGDQPGGPVDDWAVALCLLARRADLDLAVEGPTVPSGLLPEPDPSTRVVRAEPPAEWYPQAHRDAEAGDLVLTETVEYAGEGPLTAAELPTVEGETVLSDAWVEATVERLRADGDEDRSDLAEAVVEARRSGELRRRLVVEAGDGAPAYRIDRSVFEVGIDDVEIRSE